MILYDGVNCLMDDSVCSQQVLSLVHFNYYAR